MKGKILLIGNFNNRCCTEYYANRRIYNDYKTKGYSVRCLDLSGYACPDDEVETIKINFNIERKGGGTGLLAYYCIFKVMITCMFTCTTFHYITNACTRPSYSYMFLIGFTGLVLFKSVVFTFYSDLYTFMGPLRSKWNGYPLAGVSILLASRVMCDSSLALKVSRNFYPCRYKYVVKKTKLDKNAWENNSPDLNVIFTARFSDLANSFISYLISKRDTNIVLVCDEEYRSGLDSKIKEKVMLVDQNDKSKVRSYLTPGNTTYEAVTCNGQYVFPDQMLISKKIAEFDKELTFERIKGLIKCDTSSADGYNNYVNS